MTKNRKVLFLSLALVAVILVLGGTTVSGYMQASKYKMNLNYNYQRAVTDLGDCVDNIENTLNKSIYANTPTQQNGLAAKLMRETSMAKAALGILPLESGNLANVNKFISQVGDFSMALSSKISAGGSISEEEYASMENLEQYAKKLKEGLDGIQPDFDAGPVDASFQQAADDFTDYPSLIYDGPFSDHIGQQEPKLLAGQSEVPQGNAQNNAASFLGVTQDKLTHTQDSAGGLPTYNFDCGTIRISVTKAGGVVSAMTDGREIGEIRLDADGARTAAQGFLEAKGIQNMKESYYVINDGICTINYAYSQNGVTCYPDLVKVAVALDTGGIVEYNATGYIMNHTDRGALTPKITQEEAQKSVSPRLKVESGSLALIPTPGLNEVLCYEFQCTGENEDRVLVYINASTGMEEQIFILMQSDSGVLVK